VLRFLREFADRAPDEIGILGNLRLAPPLPVVPEALHGKPIVALVVTYAGSVERGTTAFQPLRDELPAPAVDAIAPKAYCAHQKMFDAALPHGRHYYWKSHKLGPLTDDIIDTVIEHCERITSPMSSVPIFTLGGAVARIAADDTAVAHRDAAHDINIVGSWLPDDPNRDQHVEWVRNLFAALEPHSRGVYVNFTNEDGDERVRSGAYSRRQWERLVALKMEYDPTNFFHCNANIPPHETAQASDSADR
jgi:hypothetical protein